MRGSTAASPFILGARRDLLYFIGTPVLLVPLVAVASRFFTAQTLYTVAMFGSLGHHLPGMMRAYGDRELLARFRTRFVVSPVLLVALCAASAFVDPSLAAIVLVTYVWGVWHGLMQTHGFLRIYDAKRGSVDRVTVRLDQAMCLTWFGAGILFSQPPVHHILQEFYMAGGPVVPLAVVRALRIVWGVALAAVTVAFVVNAIRRARAGVPPSPVKLLLLVTSVGFWWYANVIVNNLLVGVLLFELFHDVQYLAIVWVFNRRRVDAGSNVDAFTRYVFRARAPLALLYVGLVCAYGALRLVPPLPVDVLNRIFSATLAASALLHFYYDSFIWKVKERGTRAGLGIDAGALPSTVPAPVRRRWAPAVLRWSALAVPVVGLGLAFARGQASPVDKMERLGRDFPDYALAQHNFAVALATEGRVEEAVAAERRALLLERNDRGLIAEARTNLGTFLGRAARARVERGDLRGAEPLLREGVKLQPSLAVMLRDDAVQAVRDGEAATALASVRCALLLDPTDPYARALADRLSPAR